MLPVEATGLQKRASAITGPFRIGWTSSSSERSKQPTEAIAFGRRLPDLHTSLGWSGPSRRDQSLRRSPVADTEKYARYVGHHSLKVRRGLSSSTGTRNNPQIPDFYYSSLDAMLDNEPSQVTATLGSGLYSGRMYEFGFFAQDDWRVTPKLR